MVFGVKRCYTFTHGSKTAATYPEALGNKGNIMIKHTMSNTGIIRNAAGKLIGKFDFCTGELVLDGVVETMHAESMEHAMDLVAAKFK